MRGLKELEAQGYSSKQQRQLTQRIWHPWIPRKIAAMQWLHLAGGLPIGEWRAKASSANTCRQCHSDETETSEHTLFKCPRVAPTWQYLKTLRSQSHLPDDYSQWNNIRFGLLNLPSNTDIAQTSAWDAGAKIQVNDNTPWDILRASLNWNIWVQKCEEELNGHPFSLGKVLFYSWKTVIHVGAEVWRSIFRHKRSQDKITELTTLFNTVWTQQGVFATAGNPLN